MALGAERLAATGLIDQIPTMRSIAACETAVLTSFVSFEANSPIRRVVSRICPSITDLLATIAANS
jgi:hypothetical protein